MAISKISGSASRPSRNSKPAGGGKVGKTTTPKKPSSPSKTTAPKSSAPAQSEKPSPAGKSLSSALTESFSGLQTASRATVFIDDDHVGV